MSDGRRVRNLSKEQKELLEEVYQSFAAAGDWPRYRELERTLGFTLAKVVKPLHGDLVTFYTPIGANTTCSLTLRGLASVAAARDDLAHALAAIRFIAKRASQDGPSAQVSRDELRKETGLSETDAGRVIKILMNSLDVHNAIGGVTMQGDGSNVEFGVTEHSPDFVAVDTVDAYKAVNDTIAQRRAEEAELNRPVWASPERSGSSQSVVPTLEMAWQPVYHRHVEAASRQLLNDRHFSEAVRAAFQRFELEVQRRFGMASKGGKDLMAKAFGDKPGQLQLKNADEPGSTEQEGYHFMAMGAMLALRNKYSHGRRVRMSEQNAHEQLGIVSYLFRRLDGARKVE